MQIHTDSIILDNGKLLHLKQKVVDALQFKDFVIVLADPNEKAQKNNQNVFGYDLNGKLLWQIQHVDLLVDNRDYTSIYIQDQSFYLYNRCGVEVKIDPATGTVLSKELIK